MEKRSCKRFNARFHAVVLSKNKSYAGVIQDVSGEGIGYTMSTVKEAVEDLLPGEIIEVIILTPAGYTLNLKCEIKWTNAQCDNEKICMGARIIDPPVKYIEFLKTLD